MNEPGPPDLMIGEFDLVEHATVTTTEAEKTLLSRPKISVRGRLATMFALFAVGTVAITVVMWSLLTLIDRKIELIGAADRLNYEILQARRFEKNFLLYGGDLEHVDYHIDAAYAAMELSLEELRASVSAECLEFLEVNLWHYRELISKVRGLDPTENPAETTARQEIYQKLRNTGSGLVSCGQKIADRERENVHKLLLFSRLVPAVYLLLVVALSIYAAAFMRRHIMQRLLLVVALSIYAAAFMRRHIMQRLEMLMAAARRIGAGDFSPILPVRKSRDEFTDLAIAINRMSRELERREEFLLQSQKLRAVGSLTAGIAHDVNNPINNIMLTAAVLQEDFDSITVPGTALPICRFEIWPKSAERCLARLRVS